MSYQITVRLPDNNQDWRVSHHTGFGWQIAGMYADNLPVHPDLLKPGDWFTQCSLSEEPFNLWIVASVESDDAFNPAYPVKVTTANGGALWFTHSDDVYYQGRL